MEDRGRFEGAKPARPYGGKGDFHFDRCMGERNWVAKWVPRGEG